ncbi:hypothetical protein [Desulfopila aestuarii]|uniref:hypothetical protein n=1 Tax=Desulfopila aestuarii TaxID=231440 RepID=UPI0009378291|nr:hypothetical protein [Desulfopila aestuarii]
MILLHEAEGIVVGGDDYIWLPTLVFQSQTTGEHVVKMPVWVPLAIHIFHMKVNIVEFGRCGSYDCGNNIISPGEPLVIRVDNQYIERLFFCISNGSTSHARRGLDTNDKEGQKDKAGDEPMRP